MEKEASRRGGGEEGLLDQRGFDTWRRIARRELFMWRVGRPL